VLSLLGAFVLNWHYCFADRRSALAEQTREMKKRAFIILEAHQERAFGIGVSLISDSLLALQQASSNS